MTRWVVRALWVVVAVSVGDACGARASDSDRNVGSTHSPGDPGRSDSAAVDAWESGAPRLVLDGAMNATDAPGAEVATLDARSCTEQDFSDCPELASATDFTAGVGNLVPVQSFCDGVEQPVGCPASRPQPGSPCTIDGLRCSYRVDSDAVSVSTCQQIVTTLGWAETAYVCHQSCEMNDSGVPADAACSCGPDIPCDVNPNATNQDLANGIVGEAYRCCNVPPETTLEVTLSGGCVTGVNTSFGDTSAACARRLLMGRHISCAANLGCASYLVSTLP